MTDEEDFLEELIAEREKRNPTIRAMIENEVQRHQTTHAHDKEPDAAWDDDERDDLDDLIAEIAKEHPEFPAMVEATLQKRLAARARGEDPDAAAWEESDTEEQPDQEEDFLEELIAESTQRNPEFPKLMEAAAERRRALRARGEDPNGEPEEDEAETRE